MPYRTFPPAPTPHPAQKERIDYRTKINDSIVTPNDFAEKCAKQYYKLIDAASLSTFEDSSSFIPLDLWKKKQVDFKRLLPRFFSDHDDSLARCIVVNAREFKCSGADEMTLSTEQMLLRLMNSCFRSQQDKGDRNKSDWFLLILAYDLGTDDQKFWDFVEPHMNNFTFCELFASMFRNFPGNEPSHKGKTKMLSNGSAGASSDGKSGVPAHSTWADPAPPFPEAFMVYQEYPDWAKTVRDHPVMDQDAKDQILNVFKNQNPGEMQKEVNDLYNRGLQMIEEHGEKGTTIENNIEELKQQLEEANKNLAAHNAFPINQKVGKELGDGIFRIQQDPRDLEALAKWFSITLKIPRSLFGELSTTAPNEEEGGAPGGSGVPREEEEDED